MSYAPNQLTNARVALAEVRKRGLDRVAEQQTLAGILTECTAYNYANPLYPWTLPVSDGYPPTALAPSTKESCGVFQQRPHVPVWWGPQGLSVHDQALYFMDVRLAVGLFLDRLVGTTRTNEPWREIQAVQGSEFDGRPGYPYAANYQAQWATAAALIDLLDSTGTTSLIDWITRMTTPADQAELAAFKADIIAGVVAALTEGQTSEVFLNRVYYSGQAENNRKDTANKGAATTSAALSGKGQTAEDYLNRVYYSGQAENNRMDTANKTIAGIAKIAASQGTELVALAAQLDAIAATLAAQDAATAEAAK